MLVLTRKTNESIMIGDDIEIKILSIQKGAVRIGFEAPEEVIILRKELEDKDKKES